MFFFQREKQLFNLITFTFDEWIKIGKKYRFSLMELQKMIKKVFDIVERIV